MKTTVLWSAIMLTVPLEAAAAAKGNFHGFVKAEVTPQGDCPVELGRVGVQDSESKPAWSKALTGVPEGDGSAHAGNVRYDVALRARRSGTEAVELEWQALNAFDEILGTRQMSFAYKKPLEGGRNKYESEAGPRIAEGATKYRVRVLRVKFSDGTIWKADQGAAASTAEEPGP